VSGLTAGRTYYFAVKTRDESGNWSLISNVLVSTTDTSDRTPPADVRDLRSGH
jgi:chitodextrinase